MSNGQLNPSKHDENERPTAPTSVTLKIDPEPAKPGGREDPPTPPTPPAPGGSTDPA